VKALDIDPGLANVGLPGLWLSNLRHAKVVLPNLGLCHL
jgi:hypothetical protein